MGGESQLWELFYTIGLGHLPFVGVLPKLLR